MRAQRGADGGYWLARPPDEVTIGEVIRAVEGPLASVRGEPPEDVDYHGAAEPCARSGSRCAPACAPWWTS